MVTYFNKKDLVSFGSYLMSEQRKNRFKEARKENERRNISNPLPIEESLSMVYHSDVENWIESVSKK